MRLIVTAIFLSLTLALTPVMPATPAYAKAPNAPTSFADLAENLTPSVVNISSTQKVEVMENLPGMPHFPEGSPFEDFFEEFMDRRGGMQSIPQASLGSGFVIDAEKGYIITNSHVVKDAEEVRVTLHDDSTIEAEVIGRDEKTDIAVLKVETDKKLTAVSFGDSDSLRVGDWILAIGNPFGLGGTVTAGIVSARKRDINSGPYDDYIQTDASINRGNSGGPMFNLAGEVIGINTAIFSPSGGSVGIGFAIPSDQAQPVIQQIIQYGHTRRGWLGVRIQSVTEEIAESLGLEEAEGALVASVTEGGPSADAGIKAGDVILQFNGEKIDQMRGLPRIVAETPIDSEADVTIWRSGKKKKLKVKIGELEKAEEDGLLTARGSDGSKEKTGKKLASIGVTVSELTEELRSDYDIERGVTGLVIENVNPSKEAGKKGLIEGDVIVEINQKAVKKPEDAVEIIKEAEENERSSVLLLINRDGDVRFVALKLKNAKKKK